MKKYIFPAAVAFCALSAAFMSVSCVSSEAESEPYAVLAPVYRYHLQRTPPVGKE